MDIDHLTIVLKLTERCNLNCSFCYFFNDNNQSWLQQPATLSYQNFSYLLRFLKKTLMKNHIRITQIFLHGGEPLLMKKNKFSYICTQLKKQLEPLTELRITLQTNATLIDAQWLALFKKHRLQIGVSLESLPQNHDYFRKDKQRRGSYQQVAAALSKLVQAERRGDIEKVSVLHIIKPTEDLVTIFQHFLQLGLYHFDFLLMNKTYDQKKYMYTQYYQQNIIALFDEWILSNNPKIKIRLFNQCIQNIIAAQKGYSPQKTNNLILTVRSSGTIEANETLMNTSWYKKLPIWHVAVDDFNVIAAHPLLTELKQAQESLSNTCRQCRWQHSCGGGQLVNRFSKENDFANPSLYCATLWTLHKRAHDFITVHQQKSMKQA